MPSLNLSKAQIYSVFVFQNRPSFRPGLGQESQGLVRIVSPPLLPVVKFSQDGGTVCLWPKPSFHPKVIISDFWSR